MNLPPKPQFSAHRRVLEPHTLPKGKPGDILKKETIPISTLANARVTKFMYLSTNQAGKSVPVTGALVRPVVSLLTHRSGPEPLVALSPGTRGLGDQCAPSRFFDPATADPRQAEYESLTFENYLARGISVVFTDYLGAGTPQRQEYLVGRSEGMNVLDAARAALRLDPDDALTPDSPIGISGYSQGGQGSAWATEIARDYAPELRIKGAIMGGVLTDMVVDFDHFNGNPTQSGRRRCARSRNAQRPRYRLSGTGIAPLSDPIRREGLQTAVQLLCDPGRVRIIRHNNCRRCYSP